MTVASLGPPVGAVAADAARRLWPVADPHAMDPVGWVRGVLGEELWSKQRHVLESVAANRWTGVQSAHGTGKSHAATRLIAWWLSTRPDAFVVATAPTWRQIDAIVFRYLRELHGRAGLPGTITGDARWLWSDGRLVALGQKPADGDEAAFQGLHALNLLVVLDEASGVPASIWHAAEALATNPAARVLAIGNPDHSGSHFAGVCAPGSGWNRIRIAAQDAPAFTGERVPEAMAARLVSPEWVEERRRRWGETSPLYQARVLAEFPEESDDQLFGSAVIRAAQERDLPLLSGEGIEPGAFGVDVARTGRDETVVYRRQEGRLRIEHRAQGHDLMRTAGVVAALLRAHPGVRAAVDVVGVGAGVYDRLVEQGLPVVAFTASQRAYRPDRFVNRRAEAYFAFRDAMRDGRVDLDPADDELAAQLGAIRWKLNSAGDRVLLESKDDMRRRGLPSPDRADSAVMAWAAGPVHGESGMSARLSSGCARCENPRVMRLYRFVVDAVYGEEVICASCLRGTTDRVVRAIDPSPPGPFDDLFDGSSRTGRGASTPVLEMKW